MNKVKQLMSCVFVLIPALLYCQGIEIIQQSDYVDKVERKQSGYIFRL